MGDNFRGRSIDFQQRAATGTSDFDRGGTFRHSANDTAKAEAAGAGKGMRSALKFDGENMEHAQQLPTEQED